MRVWTTLVRLGPAVTGRMRRGELLLRLVSDVDSQQDVLVRGLVPAVSAMVVAAGIGLLLPEAGVTIALGLISAALLAPAVSPLTARLAERRTAELRVDVVAGTMETLTAAPDLIAFGAAARLDTALGAHGTPVSGGERQRIGVARALLADRPIVLLDEPTAHLDGPTAARLAADLNTLTAGRAALIVTHRPAEFPDLPVVSIGPRPAIHPDAARIP